MDNHIGEIIISEKELDQITTDLARQISSDFKDSGKKLLLIGILKGSFMFLSDIAKKLTIPAEIDFIKLSSYNKDKTTGKVTVDFGLSVENPEDYNMLIIEDIIDSGITLSFLKSHFKEKGYNDVKCCALLDKFERRVVDCRADYIGKKIPDLFIIGYGMDYCQLYRNLPYIAVFNP